MPRRWLLSIRNGQVFLSTLSSSKSNTLCARHAWRYSSLVVLLMYVCTHGTCVSVSIFLEGMEASYRSERESGERSRYVSVNGSRLGRLNEHRFFHSSLIFIELKRAITRGNVVGWIIRVDTRSRAPRGTRISPIPPIISLLFPIPSNFFRIRLLAVIFGHVHRLLQLILISLQSCSLL